MTKKSNHTPIIQISPTEYFFKDRENMPTWLKNHNKGEKLDISELLDSRLVYYPGAWIDGTPICMFNKAHAVHVFVYVDYGYSKEKIDSALSNDAFRGYHFHHEQEVTENELLPRNLIYHVTEEEMRKAASGYDMSIPTNEGFAILKIYERDDGLDEEHGAERFAILYIGGDANATYDVLFGNTNRSPYACVVCANMGSGYTCFDEKSLIARIAERTNSFPKYLVGGKTYGWNRYQMLKTVSYVKASDGKRFVWIKK